MSIKGAIISLSLFLCVQFTNAQDAVFSQFYAADMYLNPALVGAEQYLTLGLNYRNQYKVIIEPYVTSQASLIAPIYIKDRDVHLGGIGISVYNDHAGNASLSTTGFLANAAYNLRLSDHHRISFGVQGGVLQRDINLSEYQWGSQFCLGCAGNNNAIPPSFGSSVAQQKYIPNVSAGIMYHLNAHKDYDLKGWSAYIGASAYHLNQPDESLISGQKNLLPILMKGHGGIEFNLGNVFNVSPNFVVAMQEDAFQVNAGMYFTVMLGGLQAQKNIQWQPSYITFGGWHRLEDAYIFGVGFGNYIYSLGFSYDLNSSNLRFNTEGKGAFEISLKLRKPREKKVKRYFTPIM